MWQEMSPGLGTGEIRRDETRRDETRRDETRRDETRRERADAWPERADAWPERADAWPERAEALVAADRQRRLARRALRAEFARRRRAAKMHGQATRLAALDRQMRAEDDEPSAR